MSFCHTCGTAVQAGDGFCAECGTALRSQHDESAPTQPQLPPRAASGVSTRNVAIIAVLIVAAVAAVAFGPSLLGGKTAAGLSASDKAIAKADASSYALEVMKIAQTASEDAGDVFRSAYSVSSAIPAADAIIERAAREIRALPIPASLPSDSAKECQQGRESFARSLEKMSYSGHSLAAGDSAQSDDYASEATSLVEEGSDHFDKAEELLGP